MARRDGTLTYSIGASRSGKTKVIHTYVAKAKRLLVLDVDGEYEARFGLRVAYNLSELRDALKGRTGPQRIAFQPRHRGDFDRFCQMAFLWVKQAPGAVVIEEVARFTNNAKAVGWYGWLVATGLKYEPAVYVTAQRPQEVDKTTLGTASAINIGRANDEEDARYIAKRLGLQLSDIPAADCEILQRRKDRSLHRYRLKFPGGRPKLVPIARFTATF